MSTLASDSWGGLLGAIGGREPASSYVEIRAVGNGGNVRQGFFPVGDHKSVRAMVAHSTGANTFIGVAPRVHKRGSADAVERVWCLWVDIDHTEDLGFLSTFSPRPSIEVSSGSGGMHAYWSLRDPLDPPTAQRYNRRLALRVCGDMKATDPARVMRVPGTLNHKHNPPRLAVCHHATFECFDADDVAGMLPDSDHYRPRSAPAMSGSVDSLTRTVLEAVEGNRNAALYWACCRALEDGASLGPLEAAGEKVGLSGIEVAAVARSARRITRQKIKPEEILNGP